MENITFKKIMFYLAFPAVKVDFEVTATFNLTENALNESIVNENCLQSPKISLHCLHFRIPLYK